MSKGRRARRYCWIVLALAPFAAAAGGCASALNSSATGFVDLEPAKPSDSKSASVKNVAGNGAATGTARDASLPPAGSGFPPLLPARTAESTADLGELAAELKASGVLSAAEQQALLDDLRQADPALWPKLVHQFRLALAYRNRGQGSGARGQGDEANSASGLADVASIGTHSVPYGDAASGGTSGDQHKADSAATIPSATPQSKLVASDEPMPSQPALRPPRKSADKKAEEKTVGGKPIDAEKSNGVAKASAAAAESANSSSAGEPQLQLTKAILALEGDAAHPSGGSAAAELSRQMQLRMLYLAAGRRDDALRPIPGLSSAQQEFWTKVIYGLATYLDHEQFAGSDRPADAERRAAEAALHLRDAAERLGELAAPAVRNLAFCKEVTSFGVFKKFPKSEFKPGDEALLYCEIENLKAESTDKGYRTAVKGRYEILDGRGERVAEQEFPASDDYCARPRRDFFIPYFVSIPKRIGEGDYTLKLTVDDAQTQKTGQGSIQFTVK
jgi:hypothetical protein